MTTRSKRAVTAMSRTRPRRRSAATPAYFLGRPASVYLDRYRRATVTSLGIRPPAAETLDPAAA